MGTVYDENHEVPKGILEHTSYAREKWKGLVFGS